MKALSPSAEDYEPGYSWGFFFEDGTKEHLEFDEGPEPPENFISDLEGEWMLKAYEIYPALREVLKESPFAFVVVNPPSAAIYDGRIKE